MRKENVALMIELALISMATVHLLDPDPLSRQRLTPSGTSISFFSRFLVSYLIPFAVSGCPQL
jgi:hypothetical protein